MKVKLVNAPINDNYGRNLLHERGIEDLDGFINPTSDALQNWRDLDQIVEAVKQIIDLAPCAKVGLVVDCDCDGFTSSAILYQYLKRLKPELKIDVYLHARKAHGLEEHWAAMIDMGYDMILLPDAGSNDQEFVEKFSCPVVIIDHHLVDNTYFPPNMIVVNNQLSPNYYNKFLSGAGMAYQVCRALDYYTGESWANDYIDLAALGVVGDMMSGLEVENQYLWKTGFQVIKNPFFLSLARKQAYSITGKMGATDADIFEAIDPMTVAFYIVPLINAMVRVGTADEKMRMWFAFVDGHRLIPSLKRGAKGALEEVAVESVRECTNARSHQNKFLDAATEQLEQKIFKYDLLEHKILFVRLDDEQFPSELNGLLAMRLSQKFKHPTIVARLGDDGYIKGSARGLNNSELANFKSYLTKTGLFEYAQGHEGAFGISILGAHLTELHNRVDTELKDMDLDSSYYEVNFERQAYNNDLPELIQDLDQYRHLWSQNNPQPLIYIKNLHIYRGEIQVCGKNSDTLKLEKNGVVYMKFFAKDTIEELKQYPEATLEIVGKPNMNSWMGHFTPQIFIENYDIKSNSMLDF